MGRALGQGLGQVFVVAAAAGGKDPLLDRGEEPQRGGKVGLEEYSRGRGEVLLLLLLLLRDGRGVRSGGGRGCRGVFVSFFFGLGRVVVIVVVVCGVGVCLLVEKSQLASQLKETAAPIPAPKQRLEKYSTCFTGKWTRSACR